MGLLGLTMGVNTLGNGTFIYAILTETELPESIITQAIAVQPLLITGYACAYWRLSKVVPPS